MSLSGAVKFERTRLGSAYKRRKFLPCLSGIIYPCPSSQGTGNSWLLKVLQCASKNPICIRDWNLLFPPPATEEDGGLSAFPKGNIAFLTHGCTGQIQYFLLLTKIILLPPFFPINLPNSLPNNLVNHWACFSLYFAAVVTGLLGG